MMHKYIAFAPPEPERFARRQPSAEGKCVGKHAKCTLFHVTNTKPSPLPIA